MHLCLTRLCNICLTSPFLVPDQRDASSGNPDPTLLLAILLSVITARLFVVPRSLLLVGPAWVVDPVSQGHGTSIDATSPICPRLRLSARRSFNSCPPFGPACSQPVSGHMPHDLQISTSRTVVPRPPPRVPACHSLSPRPPSRHLGLVSGTNYPCPCLRHLFSSRLPSLPRPALLRSPLPVIPLLDLGR